MRIPWGIEFEISTSGMSGKSRRPVTLSRTRFDGLGNAHNFRREAVTFTGLLQSWAACVIQPSAVPHHGPECRVRGDRRVGFLSTPFRRRVRFDRRHPYTPELAYYAAEQLYAEILTGHHVNGEPVKRRRATRTRARSAA